VSQSTSARRRFRSLARAFSWHRRKLAVVAAVLAVLTGVAAVNPEGPPTRRVVRASSQLPGGAVIRAGDVELADIPSAATPVTAIGDRAEVIGSMLVGPVAEGQVITPLDLLTDRSTLPAGRVIAPLRLADIDLAGLLRPGEIVDVMSADAQAATAAVVASGVRVVTIPAAETADTGPRSGALVLVEVTTAEAAALARAAVTGTLTVLWR
jgi:pilus assembly protein CpaB